MPAPELDALRRRLLDSGVAARFVDRTILELKDHYTDIELDALNDGLSASAAAEHARTCLGSDAAILAAVTAQPALLTWPHRWPRAAHGVRTLAFYALLPAVPFVYCAQHGGLIARWSASVSLASILTGALLFMLQQVVAGSLPLQ